MKTEKTNNDLVIQGVLKEAFFSDSVFTVEGTDLYIRITDILESKIRDSSVNKKLFFKNISGVNELDVKTAYTLVSRFHRYTIKGQFGFEGLEDDVYVFSIPKELLLENQRKDNRVKIVAQLQTPTPVLLRTHSLHREGLFILEDSSQEGFGGTLTVVQGFPIESDTSIIGKLGSNSELGALNGKIVSATIIAPLRPDFDTFRIGITQTYESEKIPHSGDDRRKQKRYKVAFQLSLTSRMHPDQSLVIDVDDVSVSGFSGKSDIGSIVSSVPIGATFTIKDEGTVIRLIRFRGDRYQFQIVYRNAEESILWLKKMSPYIYPGIKCSTKDLRDLYRVFLQAGAVSTKYLKRHQMFDSLLVNRSQDYTKNDLSIHSWFVQGASSETEFYISALRLSNSCWVLGDIAKVSDSNIDGKAVIRGFFQSFSEFASSLPELGTLMIFWVDQHPLWMDWYNTIKSKVPELLNSEVTMSYFRLDGEVEKGESCIQIKNIEKCEYKVRAEILSNLGATVRKFLEYSFEYNESGANEALNVDGRQLSSRKYFSVETKKGELLGCINTNPDGNSINRFIDSIFLFPIKYDLKNLEVELNAITNGISVHFSVIAPSVRVIHDQNVDVGTKMTCLLLYPNAFSLF